MKCVRRDTMEFTKSSQSAIVDHVSHNRIDDAIELGRGSVRSLFTGEVPFGHFVTSRKVAARYKVTSTRLNGTKFKVSVTPQGKWKSQEGLEEGTCEIVPGAAWKMLSADGNPFGTLCLTAPHVHVMHKIDQRMPGSGPRVGDRVAFVYLQPSKADVDADTLQIARAEDPVFAAENKLQLDSVFYFEHNVRSPLEAVLEVFMKSPYASLGWQQEHAEAMNRVRGQSSLSSVFGFRTAVGRATTSKIARVPKKRKALSPAVVVAKGAAGVGIGKFFTKKD